MKSLLAGIVLVGLMAASFPGWAQDSQDSMSPEIDISALPSGKNFAPTVSLLRARSPHARGTPGNRYSASVLDRNSAPLSRTVGRVDVVGVLGRDSEQAVASASDQDGQMWLLNGLGPQDRIVEPLVSTFKGRALITRARACIGWPHPASPAAPLLVEMECQSSKFGFRPPAAETRN